MKLTKTLIAAAIAGAFSAGAYAQSSVTLYGSLDAGIGYVNKVGGGALWAQTSGAMSDNYFGLRGSEDLGGGTHAIFKLESGFNIGNGKMGSWFNTNNGTLFNREAYVGLSNNQYGTVTLGRQYDSVVDYLRPLSLAGKGVNLAAHPFNNDNIGAQYSISNAIKYESTNYDGFHFGGMYSFSNSPGDFSGGRQWSVGTGYENGPLKVAAVYDQLNNNYTGALTGAAQDDGESIFWAQTQRTFGVGGNYTVGPATLGLVWTRTKLQNGFGFGNMRFDNIEANGVYSLTPSLALVGNYTFTYGRASDLNGMTQDAVERWHSVALGADYSLSKRTDVYLAGVYQHTSTGYQGPASGDYFQTSIAGMLPASGTPNQVGAVTGIRHRF
ncbi:porin [Burkholderia sp. WAC0059]|uniref:porin n=1 Tax=Burkholderia sp. WAC0059 TaxID=2066022 RepID=UPI000C7EA867|nr:porin [Burkholderia sp. WAC0059]PLZ01538.1 porin [Burkholderia sp. WAC0059]